MKKLFIASLSLIIMLGFCLFTACSCSDSSGNLTLNRTEATIEKYQIVLLEATYDGEKVLEWSSSDTSVATVVSGRVSAVGVGSATITVSDGKATAACEITVNAPNYDKLTISVEQNIVMYLSDSKTIVPSVAYDRVPIEGATFTYATEAANIAVSSDGVITATTLGEATVNVFSTLDGKNLTATITVNVVPEEAIVIQQTNVILFPEPSYGGTTYNNTIQCTAEVSARGNVITPAAGTVVWNVDGSDDVISVDTNGFVTALNIGEATLVATYNPVGGTAVSSSIIIVVRPIEVEITDKIVEIGKTTKYVPDMMALVGVDSQVNKIIVNSESVENAEFYPEDGRFDFSGLTSSDAVITLVTGKFAYTFSGIVYDGVIGSVEDMKVLLNTDSGYFKVVADIDMADYTDNGGVWSSAITFVGNINGGGHKITNFKTDSGLFRNFNGNVYDLAFVDVNATGNCGVISSGYQRLGVGNITVNNVYISLKTVSANWYIGFFGNINPGSTVSINNSILIDKTAAFNKSCFFGRFGSVAMSLNNAWLVGYSEYVSSLNTNLTPEQQRALHLPESLTDKYKKYSSLNSFIDDFASNNVSVSDFIDGIIKDDIMSSVIQITSENVAELLTATNGYYVLTEDIDMTTAYTDNNGVWASSATFTGTLNGGNHMITGLKTSSGLFAKLGANSGAATVRIFDIALIDVQITGQVGALSKDVGQSNGYLTINIDNVYVKHSVAPAWGGGGLFGRSPRLGSQGTVMNITNSVVYVNGNDGASYGSLAHTFNDTYGLTVNNCYFIGANGTLVVSANMAITPTGGGVYANFDVFQDAYDAGTVVGLSEFIETILN